MLYVSGMTGTMGCIFIAKLLHDLPFVSYWGRYSLIILCTHALLLQIIMPLARMVELPKYLIAFIVLVVVMSSYQLIIPLMKKYLPHVTAQKDVIPV